MATTLLPGKLAARVNQSDQSTGLLRDKIDGSQEPEPISEQNMARSG